MSRSWPTVKLSEVSEINPRRPAILLELPDDYSVTFVPMPAVEQFGGTICTPETRAFGEVRKGFTYFAEGDVIFAKITPCMQNGKSAVARNLVNQIGFGSTEFHVIRPDPDKVLAEWIWYFVRQGPYRQEATHHFQGAVGQQRVPASYLESTSIPLPPLSEQGRILGRIKECMELVEEVESLGSDSNKEREALLESLIEAEFHSAAGDEFVLEEVCGITSELVDPRKPGFIDSIHVGGANIESETGRLIDLKTSREEKLKSAKFPFDPSMVLYNKIRPYLKKVARPDFSGICSADMYPLNPEPTKLDKDYLFFLLLSRDFTRYAIEGSNRAGMPKVNRKHLFAYRFKMPPIDQQKQISEKLNEALTTLEIIRAEYLDMLTDESHLRDAILHKAFAGEL
jgi:type I restriction enzyme S subunit